MLWCGGLPSAISIAVIPKLQMSALVPYPVSCMTSGAIQKGVPITVFRLVTLSESCPATPKSAESQQYWSGYHHHMLCTRYLPSFATPACVSNIFPALMSLCNRLELCKYCNPSNVCWQMTAICDSVIVTLQTFMMSVIDPAAQYSIAI
jgi:hypothetical protein